MIYLYSAKNSIFQPPQLDQFNSFPNRSPQKWDFFPILPQDFPNSFHTGVSWDFLYDLWV